LYRREVILFGGRLVEHNPKLGEAAEPSGFRLRNNRGRFGKSLAGTGGDVLRDLEITERLVGVLSDADKAGNRISHVFVVEAEVQSLRLDAIDRVCVVVENDVGIREGGFESSL